MTSSPDMGQSTALFTAQQGTGEERRQAIEHIVAIHWKPLYKYYRFRHNTPAADTQSLIAAYLEEFLKPDFLREFQSGSGPLRSHLRLGLDKFSSHWRGQRARHSSFPIDYAPAEDEYQGEVRFPGLAADEYYETEWIRNLFTLAVIELQSALTAEGKAEHFDLFLQSDAQERANQDRLMLEEVAQRLGMPSNDAMNALAAARQQFHHILKDLIRSLTTSDEEYHREVRTIFKRT